MRPGEVRRGHDGDDGDGHLVARRGLARAACAACTTWSRLCCCGPGAQAEAEAEAEAPSPGGSADVADGGPSGAPVADDATPAAPGEDSDDGESDDADAGLPRA